MANNKVTDKDSSKKLHQWALNLVQDGEMRRRPFEGQWWENIATFCGDFFCEWNPRLNRLTEVPRPKHRVRLPINLAQPAVRTEFAKLVKNRPIVEAIARSNDQRDLKAADVVDKILASYVEKTYHMPKVRRRCLHWVLVAGKGHVFTDFDPTLNPGDDLLLDNEGQPVFDPAQQSLWKQFWKDKKKAAKTTKLPEGDLLIKAISPFQLLLDNSTLYTEDAKWCVVSDVLDISEVERRWNEEIEGERDVLPAVMERRLLTRFDRLGRLDMKPGTVQEMAKVSRLYIRPDHPWFPNGLHMVFTEDKLILKEEFPHNHGQLPISTTEHIPMPVTQHAQSILPQLRGPVLEVSKTISQLVENRNMMANPPWRIAEGHNVDEDTLVNKPGLHLRYRHVPNVPPPEPVQMPEMPTYVQNLPTTLREMLLDISGQGETSRGQIPPGARSGVAIAYLQEEDDTKLGPTVQEFEEMNERVAEQTCELIGQYFDLPRTMRIYKRNSEPEIIDFTGEIMAGIAGVEVQAGSALPRSKAAKQQFVLDLWDRQIERDPRKVRYMLELGEGEPDEWEVDMDQADRENAKMEGGTHCDVEPWYNHAAHLFRHRRFMKSADFESKPDNIKEVFYEHEAAHEQADKDQKNEEMIQQVQAARFAGMGTAPFQANDKALGGGGGNGGPPQLPPGSSPGGNGLPPGQNGQTGGGQQPPFGGPAPADFMNQNPQ